MKHNIISALSVLLLTVGLTSCTDESMEPDNIPGDKVAMNFTFSHPSQSRATETSFEPGDVVGLYVSPSDKVLEIAGNTVNNETVTFTGTTWTTTRQLYWDAGTYNAYAYYPRLDNIISISDLPFEISLDQSATTTDALSNYEASDFLYASSRGVTASANPVNTVTSATIDLAAGVATKAARGERKSVIARQDGPTTYSAILVPQRMENRMPLVEVVMNGVSFLYESKFLFKPGIHHIVNLVVDKNPEQVKIEIGGEITDWN